MSSNSPPRSSILFGLVSIESAVSLICLCFLLYSVYIFSDVLVTSAKVIAFWTDGKSADETANSLSTVRVLSSRLLASFSHFMVLMALALFLVAARYSPRRAGEYYVSAIALNGIITLTFLLSTLTTVPYLLWTSSEYARDAAGRKLINLTICTAVGALFHWVMYRAYKLAGYQAKAGPAIHRQQ